jgi:hypothetical protein
MGSAAVAVMVDGGELDAGGAFLGKEEHDGLK